MLKLQNHKRNVIKETIPWAVTLYFSEKYIISKLIVIILIFNFLTNSAYAAYTFQECSSIEEGSLRDELNKICQKVFSSEINLINIEKIVNTNWHDLNMDYVINKNIDNALEKVEDEYGYWDRFISSWSPSKSKEIAEKTANYAFSSESFKNNIEKVSHEIANEISQNLNTISAETASSAFMCLKEFIEKSYPPVIISTFEKEINQKTDNVNYNGDIHDMSMIDTHKKGLGGIGIIIAAQIAKKMVRKISKQISKRIVSRIAVRILGRVGSSAIPFAGWVVGISMIAWDLIDSISGAFTQIEKSFKAQNVKEKIRQEIINSVSEELPKEVPQMARNIANDLFSIWSDFKRKFRQVLALAEENNEFNKILEETSSKNLYKLSNLVNIIKSKMGKGKLMDSIDSGQFNTVMALPESSFEILKTTGSIDNLIDWTEVAGSHIKKVVEFQIYKHKNPDDLDRVLLEKIILIDDRRTISQLILMKNNLIETMLTLSTHNLKKLSLNLNSEDMKHLAWYLQRLDQNSKNEIISQLISNPSSKEKLKDNEIKNIIIESQDKEDTIKFILSNNNILKAPKLLLSGNVSFKIFFHKYSSSHVLGFSLIILIFIVMIFIIKNYFKKNK